jgi:polyhydroxyalkanoate synthase subunit PhaE
MSDNDYAKFLTDLWTKSSNAMGSAQQAMFNEMAKQMPMPGALMPWQMFGTGDPNLQNATEAFQKMLAKWKNLPGLLKQEGEKSGGDQVTAELLQKIFDPREWMSAAGSMEETVRRLAEGPKFADIGHIEGKFAALIRAWTELRTASMEHQTHLLGAWSKAASEFTNKLNEAAAKGTSLGSRGDLVAIWVEIANRHLLEAQGTPEFLETQRKLLRASTDQRLAQQELTDLYGDVLGLPTRSEIDDLIRQVADLRRELRAERRARKKEGLTASK